MKRVLVIEDQDAVKEVTKVMLELQGYAAVLADSPQDGIAKAGDKFDLILIDIMMPEMDGYQVLTEIRKNPATKGVKCVAFTAKASGADISELTKRGFDDYIIKPFTLGEFKLKIAGLL